MKDRSINIIHLKLIKRLGKFSVLILKAPIFVEFLMFLSLVLTRCHSHHTFFYKKLFSIKKTFDKSKITL